jgi:hypothetical protein
MNVLNREVYGSAYNRVGKRLRVLPVVEKGHLRSRSLCNMENRGAFGRWHIHCAIELPRHMDAISFEELVQKCWEKLDWAHKRVLVRDGMSARWIDYLLKRRRKSDFDYLLDCIDLDSLHNPHC